MRFYVTTPIYYVNAAPHLGHTYTTVVADALARYHRARGHETWFLTGTDEHGQKVEEIARAAGKSPRAYADEITARFKETWKRLDISNDYFIRTTDEAEARFNHRASVEEMWKRIEAAGDLYMGEYDGLYCSGCEGWKTDDELTDGEDGAKLCPIHKKPVDRVKEPNYFFRLSKYQDWLLRLYQDQPDFIRPESRRNEVAEFVKSGLRDLSVSRTSVKWGFPVPDNPSHTIYVWIDALTNYVSALGGPSAVEPGGPKHGLWTSCLHIMAKDIPRFHGVYWPAMLKSAGLPLPKGLFCHGYLTVKGEKMAKSMPATRVDPIAVADGFREATGTDLGADALRYFLLREYPFGGDGDFTYEALFQRYESDLGNDLGNLLHRTVAMAHRFLGGSVPAASSTIDRLAASERKAAEEAWDALAPSRAVEATWKIVRAGNRYIDEKAPWSLAKTAATRAALEEVLANGCETLRWAAMMIAPVMPERAREILRQLGRAADDGKWPSDWEWPGGRLAKAEVLFPRIEPDRQASLIARWVPAESAASAPAPTSPPATTPEPATALTKTDFDKVQMLAAKVVECERVPKTDKLFKLVLDIGSEERTVVSGIADVYTPAELVGRTVVYLANLEPAKIRGIVSQGMILAAGDAKVLGLAGLDREVPPGTRIR